MNAGVIGANAVLVDGRAPCDLNQSTQYLRTYYPIGRVVPTLNRPYRFNNDDSMAVVPAQEMVI